MCAFPPQAEIVLTVVGEVEKAAAPAPPPVPTPAPVVSVEPPAVEEAPLSRTLVTFVQSSCKQALDAALAGSWQAAVEVWDQCLTVVPNCVIALRSRGEGGGKGRVALVVNVFG